MNVGDHEIVCQSQPSPKPACGACGTLVALETLPLGMDGKASCGRCSAEVTTYPAPSWLGEELPSLRQIYGAEREVTSAHGMPAPRTSAARGDDAVILSCPNCGGSLRVTGETQRTTPCTYCQTNVFLPDDLWRRLHPVKTVRAWSIAFRGQLQTREELESKARKKAKEAREAEERAARERAEEAERARQAAVDAEVAKREKKTGVIVAVVFIVAVVAAVVVAAFFAHPAP
jgi:hypothetical protein